MSVEKNGNQISLRNHGNVSYNGMCEDDDEEKEDAEVNIGEAYQAVIPPLEPPDTSQKSSCREVQVWAPTLKITDDDLEAYISNARNVCNLTEEQVLGLLYWCDYSVQEASNSLQVFQARLTEWSDQDRALFEIAYQKFGKEFGRIRKYMLKDKSRSCIVEYYYSWKISWLKKSFFDQQLKLEADLNAKDEDGKKKSLCDECGIECLRTKSKSNDSLNLRLCLVCRKCFEKTGVVLSSQKPICFGKDKASLLTEFMEEMNDPVLLEDKRTMKELDAKIAKLRKRVQRNKQLISTSTESVASRITKFKKTKKIKIFSKWSDREQKLAQVAIEEYKMNSKDLSEILRTKSEAQVQSFMDMYYKD